MNFLKKHKIFLIFVGFFFLVLLQHQFLYLYFDDYGYASLTYNAHLDNVTGLNYNLIDIFKYLVLHYNNWGGRILYFFVEIVLLKIGLPAFRLFQSVAITGIFYLIYKLATTKLQIDDWKIALTTVSLYGFFSIFVIRHGILWISASVLYVIPMFFLFLFVYLYTSKTTFKSNIKKSLFYIFLTVIIFVASFSQEQISVAMLSFIIMYTIYSSFKNKKIQKLDIIMCVFSLAGFLILMLAPGNQVRMLHPSNGNFYELSLVQRVLRNIPAIITSIFGKNNSLFLIIFMLASLFCSYKTLNFIKKIKYINILALVINSFVFLFTIIYGIDYAFYFMEEMSNSTLSILYPAVLAGSLISFLYPVILYLCYKEHTSMLILFLAGILSQCAMLVAPYYTLRCAIIFELVYFIIIVMVVIDIKDTFKKFNILYIVMPLLLVSAFNYTQVTHGYYKNSDINDYNDTTLKEISERISNGETIEKVTLKKLVDETYGSEMPYIPGNEYMFPWIKNYYSLPQDIVIDYE